MAVVPLIRGIPPKGGGGLFLNLSPRRGESPPHFPIGKKTPLNPPLSGGQKALPLRGRLASLSGMETALDPPLIREVCCRCPPDKGEYPRRGGGGLFLNLSPRRGESHPTSLSGRKPPLIPPCQGGQKLPSFGGSPRRREEVRRRCPPDKRNPPKGGRGFVFKSLPPKGGAPNQPHPNPKPHPR